MELTLRFGTGMPSWCPTLQFKLDQVGANRREEIRLQAGIATVSSKHTQKPGSAVLIPVQKCSNTNARSGFVVCSWLFVLTMGLPLCLAVVIAGVSVVMEDKSHVAQGNVFVSLKPFHTGKRDMIYWEPKSEFDGRFVMTNHSTLQVTDTSLAHVSISLHHSNLNKNGVFKVYNRSSEITTV